jgi:hypothetical protein
MSKNRGDAGSGQRLLSKKAGMDYDNGHRLDCQVSEGK